ncbi:MAG: DUF1127 domain-containing protein [Mesorhizobium sp.]|nr:DUF1127 domain-containing protein [Mesorhizobium sp.]
MDQETERQIAWPRHEAGRWRVRDGVRLVLFLAARRRQRQVLAMLADHELLDIGLSRDEALREAAKPFWRD